MTRLARPSVTYCKLGAPESAVQGKTPLRYFDVPKEEGGVSRLVFEVIIGCRLEVTANGTCRVARNVTARERSHGFCDY